jgi:hypothetical protein
MHRSGGFPDFPGSIFKGLFLAAPGRHPWSLRHLRR